MHLLRRDNTCGAWKAVCVLTLLLVSSSAALGAGEIHGTVRNQTRSRPAVGDEVILFRIEGQMQEVARARTDARGKFTFHVPYPNKPCLVRVIHQRVGYDQAVSTGQALSLQVFDAAPQVRGVTGNIEILRAGTNGNLLHVSDLIEVRNDSSPPFTEVGERTFEVYLPVEAKIDSVLAAGPEKIAAAISVAPVPDELGHYTVNFPLRPGATRFAFNYDLPYDGHAVFQPRHAYPLQQFAVVIPPTMKFFSRSPAFQTLATRDTRYQVRAATQVMAGAGPQFEISGVGALLPFRDLAQSQAPAPSPAVSNPIAAAANRPDFHSLTNINLQPKQTQASSQSLLLKGITSILAAGCALWIWRSRKAGNF